MSAPAVAAVLAGASVLVGASGWRGRRSATHRPLGIGAGTAARRPRRGRPTVLLVVGLPAAVVVIGLPGAIAAAGLVAGARVERRRRGRHRLQRERDAAFPDLVDLFRIAAVAGHPVHRCVEVVAARAPAPARPPLATALARTHRGVPLAEALEAIGPELGTSGPVLTDALRSALRTGSPLGPVLDQVVAVARDRRVRSAQAAARRLPVSMLFPLVCCVLPAFGLLAVAPLLAGSLGSLSP